MSFAYHPQSDGQTKVANHIVDQYLGAFVHIRPSSWGCFLLWEEWSYNTSFYSATRISPFEITFSRKPPNFPQYIVCTSKIEVVDEMLGQREVVFALLRSKLLKSQAHMKHIADTHRREHQFNIGDWVMVKLRPHRQVSATGSSYSKLAKRYYRPFQVKDRMGNVAYKLKLPEQSRIHPMFHCSILKPYFQPTPTSSELVELPPLAIDNQPIVTPLTFLATKWIPSPFGPK